MAVRQLPKEKATKDGRRWCFYDRIKVNGLTKLYVSKNYMTKAKAIKAERDFLVGLENKQINVTNMTFKQLHEEFYKYKKDKVKENTLYGYKNKLPYLKSLYKVKLKDFNYPTFERLHDEINSTHLATRTKNDIYKLLKTILCYCLA